MSGAGGLFLVRMDPGDGPLAGKKLFFRARGGLRADSGILPGDFVTVEWSASSLTPDGLPADDRSGLPGAALCAVGKRKNELIRPPMANLDLLFVIIAAVRPAPSFLTVDKLLAVCEDRGIDPVIVVTKCDLSPVEAERIRNIYLLAGYPSFCVSSLTGEGTDKLRGFIGRTLPGRLTAFAGVSGAGKSSLLNRIFPGYGHEEGEVSRKTGRGRHTTRKVEIFERPTDGGECLIADTPGFSAIDFENFDFLTLESLPAAMREFRACYPDCRWADCTHTGEADCGVVRAVSEGRVAASRRESYLEMYRALKKKERHQN